MEGMFTLLLISVRLIEWKASPQIQRGVTQICARRIVPSLYARYSTIGLG